MAKKIAMLVSNPCDPDYRVHKEAESLVQAGFEVRVYCTWRPKLGIPVFETLNGVTYVRYEWNVLKVLRQKFLGEPPNPYLPKINREKNRQADRRNPPL